MTRPWPTRFLAVLGTATVLGLAASAGTRPKAREVWMGGFVKLEEAEKAEAGGDPVLALELLRDAAAVFQHVRRDYPTWNPSLLAYRINYCAKRIEHLESKVSEVTAELPRDDLVSLSTQNAEKIKAVSLENQELRRRLGLVEQALARARREAARSSELSEQAQTLMEENRKLREQDRIRTQTLQQQETELTKLRQNAGSGQMARALQEQLDRIRERKLELDKTFESYRDAFRDARAQLEEANAARRRQLERIATLEADAAARQRETAAQATTIRELEQQRTEARAATRTLQATITNLETRLADRDAASRELQEELADLRAARDSVLAAAQIDPQPGQDAAPAGTDVDLAAIGKLLKAREADLTEARQRLAALEEDVAAASHTDAVTRAELERQTAETTRLSRMLDALQTANATLTARLQHAAETTAAQSGQLAESRAAQREQEARLADLTRERDVLKVQRQEGLDLSRTQEEQIRKLEADAAARDRQVRDRAETITALQAQLPMLQSKESAFDGLADTLQDADTAADRMQRQLAGVEAERDSALQLLEELGRELRNREDQLQRLREQAAGGGAAGNESAWKKELLETSRQLETERQRRRTLEALLAKQDSSNAGAAPAAPTVAPDTERENRRRDREMVVRGLLRQGTTAESQGKLEAARWNYEKVLSYEPDERVALARLGLMAAEHGQIQEAEGYLRRAFRLDPDDVEILIALGFVLIRQEKPDLAISMLSRAAALRPDDPVVHRSLGVACSSLGWTDAAEVQLRRALKLDEADSEAAFNLAVLLAAKEPARREEAQTWYKRARELGMAADPGLDAFFEITN